MLQAALAAVHGRVRVRDDLCRSPYRGEAHLVAIGKAAAAMSAGAYDALGERIVRGLVVTKHGHRTPELPALPTLTCIEAGHPLPDAASLAAGAALLEFIAAAPAGAAFVFLISGGASSLVEVPPAGVELSDLQRAHQWLLGSGLDIVQMNRVRKRLSCIKGGRLATHLAGRPARVLLISDVPGDALAVIGSGLLVPDSGPVGLPGLKLPRWLQDMMRRVPPAPGPDDAALRAIEPRIVACLDDAKRAACERARALGHDAWLHAEFVAGDALEAGVRLSAELTAGPAGVHVWGGETTVRLPPRPGRGGRNQSLALAAARVLAGRDDALLLAVNTDGSDGPGEDAGALVDGATLGRGELDGLDAARCLAAADAGTFLEASGDLIQTGATGTNVMDVTLGLKM
ncbi:MAG: DUF4147 domain-containing protein [Gammaproteobacteria bacterium]|nr:DUF4147 domain-containing protein [Gammaproteobacteria bacterium]